LAQVSYAFGLLDANPFMTQVVVDGKQMSALVDKGAILGMEVSFNKFLIRDRNNQLQYYEKDRLKQTLAKQGLEQLSRFERIVKGEGGALYHVLSKEFYATSYDGQEIARDGPTLSALYSLGALANDPYAATLTVGTLDKSGAIVDKFTVRALLSSDLSITRYTVDGWKRVFQIMDKGVVAFEKLSENLREAQGRVKEAWSFVHIGKTTSQDLLEELKAGVVFRAAEVKGAVMQSWQGGIEGDMEFARANLNAVYFSNEFVNRDNKKEFDVSYFSGDDLVGMSTLTLDSTPGAKKPRTEIFNLMVRQFRDGTTITYRFNSNQNSANGGAWFSYVGNSTVPSEAFNSKGVSLGKIQTIDPTRLRSWVFGSPQIDALGLTWDTAGAKGWIFKDGTALVFNDQGKLSYSMEKSSTSAIGHATYYLQDAQGKIYQYSEAIRNESRVTRFSLTDSTGYIIDCGKLGDDGTMRTMSAHGLWVGRAYGVLLIFDGSAQPVALSGEEKLPFDITRNGDQLQIGLNTKGTLERIVVVYSVQTLKSADQKEAKPLYVEVRVSHTLGDHTLKVLPDSNVTREVSDGKYRATISFNKAGQIYSINEDYGRGGDRSITRFAYDGSGTLMNVSYSLSEGWTNRGWSDLFSSKGLYVGAAGSFELTGWQAFKSEMTPARWIGAGLAVIALCWVVGIVAAGYTLVQGLAGLAAALTGSVVALKVTASIIALGAFWVAAGSAVAAISLYGIGLGFESLGYQNLGAQFQNVGLFCGIVGAGALFVAANILPFVSVVTRTMATGFIIAGSVTAGSGLALEFFGYQRSGAAVKAVGLTLIGIGVYGRGGLGAKTVAWLATGSGALLVGGAVIATYSKSKVWINVGAGMIKIGTLGFQVVAINFAVKLLVNLNAATALKTIGQLAAFGIGAVAVRQIYNAIYTGYTTEGKSFLSVLGFEAFSLLSSILGLGVSHESIFYKLGVGFEWNGKAERLTLGDAIGFVALVLVVWRNEIFSKSAFKEVTVKTASRIGAGRINAAAGAASNFAIRSASFATAGAALKTAVAAFSAATGFSKALQSLVVAGRAIVYAWNAILYFAASINYVTSQRLDLAFGEACLKFANTRLDPKSSLFALNEVFLGKAQRLKSFNTLVSTGGLQAALVRPDAFKYLAGRFGVILEIPKVAKPGPSIWLRAGQSILNWDASLNVEGSFWKTFGNVFTNVTSGRAQGVVGSFFRMGRLNMQLLPLGIAADFMTSLFGEDVLISKASRLVFGGFGRLYERDSEGNIIRARSFDELVLDAFGYYGVAVNKDGSVAWQSSGFKQSVMIAVLFQYGIPVLDVFVRASVILPIIGKMGGAFADSLSAKFAIYVAGGKMVAAANAQFIQSALEEGLIEPVKQFVGMGMSAGLAQILTDVIWATPLGGYLATIDPDRFRTRTLLFATVMKYLSSNDLWQILVEAGDGSTTAHFFTKNSTVSSFSGKTGDAATLENAVRLDVTVYQSYQARGMTSETEILAAARADYVALGLISENAPAGALTIAQLQSTNFGEIFRDVTQQGRWSVEEPGKTLSDSAEAAVVSTFKLGELSLQNIAIAQGVDIDGFSEVLGKEYVPSVLTLGMPVTQLLLCAPEMSGPQIMNFARTVLGLTDSQLTYDGIVELMQRSSEGVARVDPAHMDHEVVSRLAAAMKARGATEATISDFRKAMQNAVAELKAATVGTPISLDAVAAAMTAKGFNITTAELMQMMLSEVSLNAVLTVTGKKPGDIFTSNAGEGYKGFGNDAIVYDAQRPVTYRIQADMAELASLAGLDLMSWIQIVRSDGSRVTLRQALSEMSLAELRDLGVDVAPILERLQKSLTGVSQAALEKMTLAESGAKLNDTSLVSSFNFGSLKVSAMEMLFKGVLSFGFATDSVRFASIEEAMNTIFGIQAKPWNSANFVGAIPSLLVPLLRELGIGPELFVHSANNQSSDHAITVQDVLNVLNDSGKQKLIQNLQVLNPGFDATRDAGVLISDFTTSLGFQGSVGLFLAGLFGTFRSSDLDFVFLGASAGLPSAIKTSFEAVSRASFQGKVARTSLETGIKNAKDMLIAIKARLQQINGLTDQASRAEAMSYLSAIASVVGIDLSQPDSLAKLEAAINDLSVELQTGNISAQALLDLANRFQELTAQVGACLGVAQTIARYAGIVIDYHTALPLIVRDIRAGKHLSVTRDGKGDLVVTLRNFSGSPDLRVTDAATWNSLQAELLAAGVQAGITWDALVAAFSGEAQNGTEILLTLQSDEIDARAFGLNVRFPVLADGKTLVFSGAGFLDATLSNVKGRGRQLLQQKLARAHAIQEALIKHTGVLAAVGDSERNERLETQNWALREGENGLISGSDYTKTADGKTTFYSLIDGTNIQPTGPPAIDPTRLMQTMDPDLLISTVDAIEKMHAGGFMTKGSIRMLNDLRSRKEALEQEEREQSKRDAASPTQTTVAERFAARAVLDRKLEEEALAAAPLAPIQQRTQTLLDRLGLEMVVLARGVAGQANPSNVYRVRVKAGAPAEVTAQLQRMAQIINGELDLFHVVTGAECGLRLGVQQVEAIVNIAFGGQAFHRIPAGGGKNKFIFATASVINRMVQKQFQGDAVFSEFLKAKNIVIGKKFVFVLHNSGMYKETAEDAALLNYLRGDYKDKLDQAQFGQLFGYDASDPAGQKNAYDARHQMSVQLFNEDHLNGLRNDSSEVDRFMAMMAAADIVVAHASALGFLNNDHRGRKWSKEGFLKELRRQNAPNAEQTAEQYWKTQEKTEQIFSDLFSGTRFLFDEADTSYEEPGCQKGAAPSKLAGVHTQVPGYIDSVLDRMFGSKIGLQRMEAERGLTIVRIRYNGTEEVMSYRDWQTGVAKWNELLQETAQKTLRRNYTELSAVEQKSVRDAADKTLQTDEAARNTILGARAGAGMIVDMRFTADITNIADDLGRRYGFDGKDISKLLTANYADASEFAKAVGEFIRAQVEKVKNDQEALQKLVKFQTAIQSIWSVYAENLRFLDGVAQEIAAENGWKTEEVKRLLLMTLEEFEKEAESGRKIGQANKYDILKNARASLVGRALALKQYDREHVALYNEIVGVNNDKAAENDLILLGDVGKESARQLLQIIYSAGRHAQKTTAEIEAMIQSVFSADENSLLSRGEAKSADLAIQKIMDGGFIISSGVEAQFKDKWHELLSGKITRIDPKTRKQTSVRSLELIKNFRIQDMVKVMSGNSVAPRLQQSDPYLAAHTQLIFMRYYAQIGDSTILAYKDSSEMLEAISKAKQSKFLASVGISQDSVRSSRSDMIRQIQTEYPGKDRSVMLGFSGTLNHMRDLMGVTYGVEYANYMGDSDPFFAADGNRSISNNRIDVQATEADVVRSINIDKNKGAADNVCVLMGMKQANVSSMLAAMAERFLNNATASERFDTLIVKTAETAWERWSRLANGEIYREVISFDNQATDDVKRYVLNAQKPGERVAFFFDMGATRGVDVTFTANTEFVSLLNTGSYAHDAIQLWSRDRGVRFGGENTFVYAQEKANADAYLRGEIRPEILELVLAHSNDADFDAQALALFNKLSADPSWKGMLSDITQYKGAFIASKSELPGFYNVFHKMTIVMQDASGAQYDAKSVESLLKRNGDLAVKDVLLKTLIEDLEGSLIDILDAQRLRNDITAAERDVLDAMRNELQNSAGVNHDVMLGGAQTGLDALNGTREKLYRFLRSYIGYEKSENMGTEIKGRPEFGLLSPALQTELKKQMKVLEPTIVLATQKPTFSDSSNIKGTTQSRDPVEVLARMRELVTLSMLPNYAVTAGSSNMQTQGPQTLREAMDHGNGFESDVKNDTTETETNAKGEKASRYKTDDFAVRMLDRIKDSLRRNFWIDGDENVLALGSRMIQNLQALTRLDEGELNSLAAALGIVDITDREALLIPVAEALTAKGIGDRRQGASIIQEVRAVLVLADRAQNKYGVKLTPEEILKAMRSKDAVMSILSIISSRISDSTQRKLFNAETGTLVAQKTVERRKEIAQSRNEVAKRETMRNLAKWYFSNKKWAGLRRDWILLSASLRQTWFNAGEGIKDGLRKLNPWGHAWRTNLEALKAAIGDPATMEASEFMARLYAFTGRVDASRDTKNEDLMLDAYKKLYEQPRSVFIPKNEDQLMRFLRGYAGLVGAFGPRITPEQKEKCFEKALQIGVLGKTVQQDGSSSLDIKDWWRISSARVFHPSLASAINFMWSIEKDGEGVEEQELRLGENTDPIVDAMRMAWVVGKSTSKITDDIKKEFPDLAKAEEAIRKIEKQIQENRKKGIPVTEVQRKTLRDAYAERDQVLYTDEGIAKITAILGGDQDPIAKRFMDETKILTSKGAQAMIEGVIKELEVEVAKLSDDSADKARFVLMIKTLTSIKDKVEVIPESDQHNALAMQIGDGVVLVRSFLKKLYSLETRGKLTEKEVRSFILPYFFHETGEYLLSRPEIVSALGGDEVLLNYVNFGSRVDGQDSIGQVVRDIFCEGNASAMIALLGAEYVDGMQKAHREMGTASNQLGLYSRKATFYKDIEGMSGKPLDDRERIDRVHKYLGTLFGKYYFDVIDAIERGNLDLAKELLLRKEAQNRTPQGAIKGREDLTIGLDTIRELKSAIDIARAGRAKDPNFNFKDFSQTLRDHIIESGISLMNIGTRAKDMKQRIDAEIDAMDVAQLDRTGLQALAKKMLGLPISDRVDLIEKLYAKLGVRSDARSPLVLPLAETWNSDVFGQLSAFDQRWLRLILMTGGDEVILQVLGASISGEYEGEKKRTLLVNLQTPVTIAGQEWSILKIKGGKINPEGEVRDFLAISADRQAANIFEMRDGAPVTYQKTWGAPLGGLFLDDARTEYEKTLEMWNDPVLYQNGVGVNPVVGYGQYTTRFFRIRDGSNEEKPLGYVVELLPAPRKGQKQDARFVDVVSPLMREWYQKSMQLKSMSRKSPEWQKLQERTTELRDQVLGLFAAYGNLARVVSENYYHGFVHSGNIDLQARGFLKLQDNDGVVSFDTVANPDTVLGYRAQDLMVLLNSIDEFEEGRIFDHTEKFTRPDGQEASVFGAEGQLLMMKFLREQGISLKKVALSGYFKNAKNDPRISQILNFKKPAFDFGEQVFGNYDKPMDRTNPFVRLVQDEFSVSLKASQEGAATGTGAVKRSELRMGAAAREVMVSALESILDSGEFLTLEEIAHRFFQREEIKALIAAKGIAMPMDIKDEIDFVAKALDAMVPDVATATQGNVRTFAHSVLLRAPSGLAVDETLIVSKPASDLRKLFEQILFNRSDKARFDIIGQFMKYNEPTHWGVVAQVASSVMLANADAVSGLRTYIESIGIKIPTTESGKVEVAAGDWREAVRSELRARGKDESFVESLKLTLLKIDMMNLSEDEKAQLAQVFAKFLMMMPNIEVATAFLGQNNIVLKFHANDAQFRSAQGQPDRLAYVSYDSRGARPPIIGLNVTKLLDTTIPLEVRAVRYLGIPLSQEEAHYNLTKVLRMVPELVKPGNEAMYDTVQEVLAYVVTMNDMKQATEDYGTQIPELDFTKQMANITYLWETATGLPLKPELRAQILGLHKSSDPKAVQELLRMLMGAITEAQKTPPGLAAQGAFVGKPIDQVMKYDDKFVVAIQIADREFAELCQQAIVERGYQKNIAMMDAKGNVEHQTGRMPISVVAQQYPGRTVAAMSDVIGSVATLAGKQQVLAMMFDRDMIRELKNAPNSKARIGEVLEALRIVAMGLDPRTLAYLQNTGGGTGGPGGAFQYPTVGLVFDAIRQSLYSEFLAARAA
jgi:hypothetical protein